jgi:hypothetical protein
MANQQTQTQWLDPRLAAALAAPLPLLGLTA